MLASVSSVKAQQEYDWKYQFKYSFPRNYNGSLKTISDKKISLVKTVEKKNGKLTKITISEYGKKGQDSIYQEKLANGKVKFKCTFFRQNDGCWIDEKYNSKNQIILKKAYSYDTINHVSTDVIYKKNRLKLKTVHNYLVLINKDSKKEWNTSKLELFKGNNQSPFRSWIYSYYPDGSKKSSVIYNSKGKIKYVWNYDCKPEGELVKKHKDTTLVCKQTEYDADGNKVLTERKFDAKGKPTKEVTRYTKDDKLISCEYYNSDDVLTGKWVYDKKTGFVSGFIGYNKGKENYKWEKIYNENGVVTVESTYRNGIKSEEKLYEYSDSDLIKSHKSISYKKNGKTDEKLTEYEYSYY